LASTFVENWVLFARCVVEASVSLPCLHRKIWIHHKKDDIQRHDILLIFQGEKPNALKPTLKRSLRTICVQTTEKKD
jgi:hypothetical protein